MLMNPVYLPASRINPLTCFITLLLTISLGFSAKAQLQVFTLEHNTTSSIYTNLDSAIAAAVNGDVINLPGGLITFSGTIRKGISLVGAGAFPDSTVATSQTMLTNTVNVKRGANNFSATGIFFQNPLVIDSCTNIAVSRCRLYNITVTNSQNILMSECVDANDMTSSGISNFTVQNSLIYGFLGPGIGANAGGVSFYNNIFFKGYNGGTLFYNNSYNVTNCYFANNIIHISQGVVIPNGNVFYNNVFTNTANNSFSSVFQNNKTNYSLATIFLTGNPNTAAYQSGDNFHLAAGSAAIGAGLGGTDCGIYGGTTPWKDGSMPYNPHIQSATVPGITDQNGNLNVVFKVSAQDN